MEAKIKCPFCESENIKLNRAHTIFCMQCHYVFTRRGNISRNVTHPLSNKYGWGIKKTHSDYSIVNKTTFGRKKLTCFIQKSPTPVWVRDR